MIARGAGASFECLEALDAELSRVAFGVGVHLVIGDLAEAFWTADGWRRLGYATESQYARERLGMSLSAVKAKRAPSDATMKKLAAFERRIVTRSLLQRDESRMFAGVDKTDAPALEDADGPTQSTWKGDLRARGRVTLRFRVSAGTLRYYRWLERMYLRHGPRAGSFFRYLCLSFIGVWQQRPTTDVAYASIYARDLYRCTSPVCSRRDLTPHHLVFRSAGGDDSEENVAALCVWCHLEGVHGGALGVKPPASGMRWRIGRQAHTVVQGRRRTSVADRTGELEPFGYPRGTVPW